MSEELTVLLEVARRLQRASLPYMVTGSMAVGFYALPRMTRDIDVVLEVGVEEADKVYRLFSEDFYVDREAVRQAIGRQGMFNIIHTASVIKIDFIVRKDETYRREEFQRRRTVTVEGVDLVMVSPEDLVLSKLVWARDSRSELHLSDARNVLKSSRHLDYAYMERWAVQLSVMDLYREALA